MTEMMPKTLQDVLDSIIAERGGPDAFTPVQTIAARGLTRCLGALKDGDTSKAASIAALQDMLPPKVEGAAGPALDLGKLSDREVFLVEQLTLVAQGIKPRREHAPKSRRHWMSFDLVALLDRIEARGKAAPITVDEQIEVRSLVSMMISDVVLPAHLWYPQMFAGNEHAQDASEAADRSSISAAGVDAHTGAGHPRDGAGNVVPLRSPPSRKVVAR